MIHAHKLLIIIGGCLVLVGLGACTSAEPNINRNMPTDAPAINLPPATTTAPPTNANAANLNSNEPAYPVNANNASVVTELEDSVITSTNDYQGNRIETRVFRADPRVSQVVVVTAANKHRQARVYGNHGEVRPLPAQYIQNALIMTGDELADAVGIALDKAPKRPVVPTPAPQPSVVPSPAGKPTPPATGEASPTPPTPRSTPPPIEP